MVFTNGFHPTVSSEAMFFNAFDHNHGWQVFVFDGYELHQLSRFHTKITANKVEETAVGGGVVTVMKPYNHAVIFHVIGKTTDGAIYYAEGNRLTKLAKDVVSCSEPVVMNDTVYIEAIFKNEESQIKRTMIISKDGDIRKGSKIPASTLSLVRNVNTLNGEIYGVRDGVFVKWTDLGYINTTMPYTHVQNCFLLNDDLCFTAMSKGSSKLSLFSMNKSGEIEKRGNIFPGMNMLMEQRPLVANGVAYFVADPSARSLELFKLTSDSLIKVGVLTTRRGYRTVQGMAWSRDQLFINVCGVRGSTFDLMQFDGNTLKERNPEYLTDVRNTVVFNDQLVFLASESGNEALYASEPVLPPDIHDDTFRVFDFWNIGKSVGQVRAEDESGRIRYHIISGNDGHTFDVDYFSGELKIANTSNLKNRQGEPFTLRIAVENRQGATAEGAIRIEVIKGQKMDTRNLRETMLFFPDLSRKSTLTTRSLKEGQVVRVYDVDFNMIDELVVRNKAIVLGSYTPGIYLLYAKTKENLYQKIELH